MGQSGDDGAVPTQEDLARLVLGADPTLTRQDVADALGVELAEVRKYWRALGFADVGDAPVFSELDVAALRGLLDLVSAGAIKPDMALRMARAMGRAMAPLSAWLTELVAEELEPVEDPEERWQLAYELTQAAMPGLAQALERSWRRHLVVAAARLAQGLPGRPSLLVGVHSVGFADLVASTPLARDLSEKEWALRAQRFEEIASDTVAASGARMVKTLGDEVMFLCEDPVVAVETGLALLEVTAEDEDLPALSVGIATGELALRAGDVYGVTVNLASRLVGFALPDTMLVDEATGRQLVPRPDYDVVVRVPRAVAGFGTVNPLQVKRARP